MKPESESPLIFISAGEASGDIHAAGVVRELKRLHPDATFFGIGGDRMQAEGVELIEHAGRMSFMGFAEVIRHLPFILATRTRVLAEIVTRKPELILLVDYPGFHFSLLRRLKRMRHVYRPKILYYIPPQVWAWKAGRAAELAEVADRIATIFPFEPEIFERHGGAAQFVGHPLLDEVEEIRPRGEFFKSIGLEPDDRVVGLFPGSRKQEIRRHLPLLLKTAKVLRTFQPDLKFVLAEAPGVPLSLYTHILRRHGMLPDFSDGEEKPRKGGASGTGATFIAPRSPIAIARVSGVSHEVLAHCNACIVKSGSSTIEAAYFGNPFVVFYKVTPLSYALGKRIVKVPYIAMANILAGEMVVRELIQDKATPENLFAEMLPLLTFPDRVEKTRAGLRKVRATLGEPGAARRVADMASELLRSG